MNLKKISKTLSDGLKEKLNNTILHPLNDIVDQNLLDITTTLGSFIVRSVRGTFQRSITLTVNNGFSSKWMEDALYGILYQWNDIKKSSRLELSTSRIFVDANGLYYRLDDGTHNLKYRNYDILLVIQTVVPQNGTRMMPQRVYTIITYDLSPQFVKDFEKDMITNRNSLLKIKADSPTINVYQDGHETDGYTYWEKVLTIPKRKLATIYLPYEQKKKIVDTINGFFASKDFYYQHGMSHNLKILLYGPPGSGKDSIAKMIASEWNRNLCYVTGGKSGKFIPNALTDEIEDLANPLYLISDIDKYPFIINEPDIDIDDEKAKQEKMEYKQAFGSMINALDGVLSGNEKIIIMTTNHREKFSDTFTRPGRIDLEMEIGYITPNVFRKFVFDFYGKEIPKDIKLNSDTLTVSTLQFDVVFRKLPFDEFMKLYVK